MLLNKTVCLCGKELKYEKFSKYIPEKLNDKFYGGRITMTATLECDCGREVKGYFTGSPIELIDLEVIKDITKEIKIDCEPTSQAVLEEETEKTVEIDTDDIDLTKMTYKELQDFAKAKGVAKVNGKKDELIKLIEEAITKE